MVLTQSTGDVSVSPYPSSTVNPMLFQNLNTSGSRGAPPETKTVKLRPNFLCTGKKSRLRASLGSSVASIDKRRNKPAEMLLLQFPLDGGFEQLHQAGDRHDHVDVFPAQSLHDRRWLEGPQIDDGAAAVERGEKAAHLFEHVGQRAAGRGS